MDEDNTEIVLTSPLCSFEKKDAASVLPYPAGASITVISYNGILSILFLSLSLMYIIFSPLGSFVLKQYDVDHFIPWSFVMNDELWNLMPMDSSLNSSKSNRLPKWSPFFIRFAKNQFIMYQLIHEKEGIRKLYESCYRDNLHSIWAGQELYRKGNSEEEFMNILQKNMQPVYDSARRQGYEVWNRG